jgi:octaheme c-type cytochrome (tetrathionate reductase family)
LKEVARHVGASSRATCGACHFKGGGGDGVKHGDLDSSLVKPDHGLDVHMDAKGLNFSCTRCHTSTGHQIEGRFYSMPATMNHNLAMPTDNPSRIACESCHSLRPHNKTPKLNDHTARVACETCHVPVFAKKKPTLVWWDWSTAGKFKEDHKFIVKKDKLGKVSYHTKKGDLGWAKNVVPEYAWFNGIITHVLATDTIDDTRPVRMTILHGDCNDPKSRITPFKMFRGKQVYDSGNKTLVVPKLFGPKGSGAYWKDYDWQKSAAAGQKVIGQKFSGEVGFVETEYLRPVAHMIAPKEEALSCESCHSRDGRLKKLTGFYMPGRDRNLNLDRIGWLSCLALLVLVGLHGAVRFITSKGRK